MAAHEHHHRQHDQHHPWLSRVGGAHDGWEQAARATGGRERVRSGVAAASAEWDEGAQRAMRTGRCRFRRAAQVDRSFGWTDARGISLSGFFNVNLQIKLWLLDMDSDLFLTADLLSLIPRRRRRDGETVIESLLYA